MVSAGFVVVPVVETALGVAQLAGGDHTGDLAIGGESEEKVAVGDGAAEGVVAGGTVLAVVVRQESDGERVFEDFLKLPRLDMAEVEGCVDEVKIHGFVRGYDLNLEVGEDFVERGFGGESVELVEDLRLSVLDEFVGPADSLHAGGYARVMQVLDTGCAEAVG